MTFQVTPHCAFFCPLEFKRPNVSLGTRGHKYKKRILGVLWWTDQGFRLKLCGCTIVPSACLNSLCFLCSLLLYWFLDIPHFSLLRVDICLIVQFCSLSGTVFNFTFHTALTNLMNKCVFVPTELYFVFFF